jgi:hypothetical protein
MANRIKFSGVVVEVEKKGEITQLKEQGYCSLPQGMVVTVLCMGLQLTKVLTSPRSL